MSLYIANFKTADGAQLQICSSELDGAPIPLADGLHIADKEIVINDSSPRYLITHMKGTHGQRFLRFVSSGLLTNIASDEIIDSWHIAEMRNIGIANNTEAHLLPPEGERVLTREAREELRALSDLREFDAAQRARARILIHRGNTGKPLLRDTFPNPNYHDLALILCRAYDQAADGKGNERHAQGQPFVAQPMQTIQQLVGTGFAAGQAIKKIQEAQRMEPEAAARDLLGAINYIAGMILHIETDAGLPGAREEA